MLNRIFNRIFRFNLFNFFNRPLYDFRCGYFPDSDTMFYFSYLENTEDVWGKSGFIELEVDNDEYVVAMEVIEGSLYYFTNKRILKQSD